MASINNQSPEELRDQLRSKLLASHHPQRKKLTLFGQEIELVQPPVGAILNSDESEAEDVKSISMILRYACVPGTDLRIFEEGDVSVILSWPWGPDMVTLQNAVLELTGLDGDDVEDAKQDIQSDPK